MSCVSFGSTGDGGRRWLERLRAAAADTRPVSSFRSPEVTDAKVRRVRALALAKDPKVRESAALSYAAPLDVLVALASDTESGVRCCVARNEHTPGAVLDTLGSDEHAGVRGWVAANPSVEPATLERLVDDTDDAVRAVAAWAGRWPTRESVTTGP